MAIVIHTDEMDELARTIAATREEVRAAGNRAQATYRLQTRLLDGFRAEATVRGFTLSFDEPRAAGGTDTAPAPAEYVLAALGACQELVYALYARVLGVPLTGVSVSVTGTQDPRGVYGVADVPAGFRAVHYHVEISSPAPAEDVARLVAAVNAHCPVLDIMTRPIPVSGQYTLNGVGILPDAS